MSRWISLNKLAEEVGMSVRALQYIRAQEPGVLVAQEKGSKTEYRQPDCVINLRNREVERAVEAERKKRQQKAHSDGDLSPRARQDRANARKAEIEVEQLERTTVRVEEAEALIVKVLNDIRSAHVALPRTWAPKLIGAKTLLEMEQRLHAENVRLMETMAVPSFGDEPEIREAA